MKHLKHAIFTAILVFTGSQAFAGTFDTVDADNNGQLSKSELRSHMDSNYSNWDQDENGKLDESEFGEIGIHDDFNSWDADHDNYLDNGEIGDGVFSRFDDDENGHWDGDEWDDAGDAGLWDV